MNFPLFFDLFIYLSKKCEILQIDKKTKNRKSAGNSKHINLSKRAKIAILQIKITA